MRKKIKIRDKVIVCGELKTTITRIKKDKYYFLDNDGKEWSETEDAIDLIK